MNELSQIFLPDNDVRHFNLYEQSVKNNIIVDYDTFNYFFEKRLMDLCIALPALIFLAPLMLIIGLTIKFNSPGAAIFQQKRIGLGGREFQCFKFRTMRKDADGQLETLLEKNPDAAAEWANNHKLKRDPRVTKLGNFLRKTSLDELPQLWNIIKGEMSLVGPRPIVRDEVKKYGKKYVAYTSVPPGVTGLWQVSGRNNTTYDERVRLDAEYANRRTIWLDLKILFMTLPVVLTSKGAY